MNLQEFKAWFEGFTESLEGKPPGPKSWKRIQEKVSLIEESPPVTRDIFVHEYWHPWRRWFSDPGYEPHRLGYGSGIGYSSSSSGQMASFDSVLAFADLGRAESASLKNSGAD